MGRRSMGVGLVIVRPNLNPGLTSDLLMNKGRENLVLALAAPGSVPILTEMAVGTATRTGGNVSTLSALEAELARTDISMWVGGGSSAKLGAMFASSSAVGTWREAGLFDSAGNMWARTEFGGTPVVKASGEVKTLYWEISFSYA